MSLSGRRRFIRQVGAAAGISLFMPWVRAEELLPRKGMRAVVVGGGFGGAIAAKTLRTLVPELEVVLVERNRTYTALPGTNWMLGGSRRIGENRFTYERLEHKYGIQMLYGDARAIDVDKKNVVLDAGTLPYDFVVVAPGVDFLFDEIEGYSSPKAQEMFPHAWRVGEEVVALKRRLDEMSNGGLVVVSLPLLPYRCPQAAYERVSQMAFYLKQAKPRSKIIVLDASQKISSLADLFVGGWGERFKGMIEYRGGQRALKVDISKSTVGTAGETLRADLVNLIPPQTAGALAHASGLSDVNKRWCPVDHASQESTAASGVYVIGDACLGDDQQKTASVANAQGKACALSIAAAIARRKPQPHFYSNVVYSLLNDTQGASALTFYRGEGRQAGRMEKGGGDSVEWSKLEGIYARAWLGAILAEMSA